jgi:tetratricopeptide (TPR) repeat protein
MELPMRFVLTKCWCAAVIAACSMVAVAGAQTAQERRWCAGEDAATAAQRIDGCSAVIKAGREKGDKLAELFNSRGIAYRLNDEYDRAITDYTQAIRLNGKFADAFNNRAFSYDRKGDYERAIQDYDQAIKLKPTPEGYFNRGNAHLGEGHYDHAIDDYNQAIRLKSDFAAAFDNRCWSRAVLGSLKQALADCNEALRLMSGKTATLASRGFVFLKMRNFDAAVSDYEAALRLNPKLAFALYGRGLARLNNEDAAGAGDIAEAKAMQADIAEEYVQYGISNPR